VLSEEQGQTGFGGGAGRPAVEQRAIALGRRHGRLLDSQPSILPRKTRPAASVIWATDSRAWIDQDWCSHGDRTSLIGGSRVSLSALLDEAAQRLPPRQAGRRQRWISLSSGKRHAERAARLFLRFHSSHAAGTQRLRRYSGCCSTTDGIPPPFPPTNKLPPLILASNTTMRAERPPTRRWARALHALLPP